MKREDQLSNLIIGAAIEFHKPLGAGLLESAYEACLAYEFKERGIPFEQQKPLPVHYKGIRLECGYRNFNVRLMKKGIKRVALDL